VVLSDVVAPSASPHGDAASRAVGRALGAAPTGGTCRQAGPRLPPRQDRLQTTPRFQAASSFRHRHLVLTTESTYCSSPPCPLSTRVGVPFGVPLPLTSRNRHVQARHESRRSCRHIRAALNSDAIPTPMTTRREARESCQGTGPASVMLVEGRPQRRESQQGHETSRGETQGASGVLPQGSTRLVLADRVPVRDLSPATAPLGLDRLHGQRESPDPRADVGARACRGRLS
jgi:hypothetical protein